MIFCPDTIASTVGFSRSERRTLLCSLSHTTKAGGATLTFLVTVGRLPPLHFISILHRIPSPPIYCWCFISAMPKISRRPSSPLRANHLLLRARRRDSTALPPSSSPSSHSNMQALMGFKASIEDLHNVLENWD
ncbi:hypothetical protein ZIOFF_066099 [Zingiber officinale]|uniref:Uncharacterized protein n=1 Tax=Zingiber officinale TaxID=94328 RepID=A0A8J5KBW8_ZINOF|nr:hypothetical protein ZIOFF_066099 [Zingiber officinale]